MAGLISPAIIEQIRAASDIVEIIGSYVPLKKAGAAFVALCPFHKEKSPSFNVNPHRQIFHCFGCGKGGDVFTFVREFENITFIEAVRRLAERARITLEVDQDPGRKKTQFVKESLLQIHEQITQRWQNALATEASGQVARDYLGRRQVSAEAVQLFRLGAAPDSWDDTVNWAKSKGYSLEIMEQAGLVIRKEGESRCYDRFRGRLMFPICDEQGRVIGFSGRVLSGDEKTAKYVNSPETPIFTKGKVIFGLDKSKRALLDSGFAIICEGQLDLIASYMAGVKNVVAPQGTALTADHARILKRYVNEVVLCFDSDNAGQNATLRALDDLLASGLAIRVATLPAPHDPDSLIKAEGAPAFQRVIDQAEGFFDYLLNRLCRTQDLGTDLGRITVARTVAEAVLKTGNAGLIDTYARKTAQRLGVTIEGIKGEFKKNRDHGPAPVDIDEEADAAAAAEGELPRPSPHEFWLARILLLDDDLVEWTAAHLDPAWVTHPLVRRIVERRLAARTQGTWVSVAAMLGDFPDEATQRLITEAVSAKHDLQDRPKQLIDVIKKIRDQHLSQQILRLAQQLGNPALADDDRDAILRQQQQLIRTKRQELTPLPTE